MIRISATILAIASLAACGAGGSEFATKTTAACIKEQGQPAAAKCACEVAIVEKELTDKEKKAILLSLEQGDNATTESGMKAMTDAGITMADMMSMGMKMMTLSAKAETECNK